MLQIGSNQITVQAFPASSDPDCQVITQSITLQYVPGNQITSCTSTTVIPPEVVLNQGDFQVTCSGNSSTFGVVVDLPNGTTTTLVLPVNQNTIMYTPTMTGIYTFTCMAGDATVALFCPSATGLVTSPTIPTDVCVDPITSLTITSHIPNQTVYTQQVTLT
ncbi:MAG: hypothetical protein Q8O99_07865 [bacterium]|nr:hypothetical protein [bacterium]